MWKIYFSCLSNIDVIGIAPCVLVVTLLASFTLSLWNGLLPARHQAMSWAGGDFSTMTAWKHIGPKAWIQAPKLLKAYVISLRCLSQAPMSWPIIKYCNNIMSQYTKKHLTQDIQISVTYLLYLLKPSFVVACAILYCIFVFTVRVHMVNKFNLC